MLPEYFIFQCYTEGEPCTDTIYYAEQITADTYKVWFYYNEQRVTCGTFDKSTVQENLDGGFYVIITDLNAQFESDDVTDMSEVL